VSRTVLAPTRRLALLFAALLTLSAGCRVDDGAAAAASTSKAAAVEITAHDYGFGLPSTLPGGLVDMALVNQGQEPHFAAFARPAEGKTLADVRAALTTPPGAAPAGPPPFLEYAALGTVSGGGTSRMTVNLPAGPYVLFCAIPAPDGTPHNVLGMMVDVEVTEAPERKLPKTPATVPTFDYAFGNFPEFKAGTNALTLENRGKQMHEIDLIELEDGKTIEDAVAWARSFQGPPPFRFLGGPAVNVGLSAVGTFDLEPGVRYAFVCIVPDTLGDMAPHLTKGMYSPVFEVRSQ
jgi:hypothetical protein